MSEPSSTLKIETMSLEKATAFDAAVAEAHIAELQRQLTEAHATISRLNKRGGYTLTHMMEHARKVRLSQ